MCKRKHLTLLLEYITCLNERRFYDAHEALEAIWFPRRFEADNEVKLLKGFINAAVSFELIKRGRVQASQKVWQNYLKYKPLLGDLDSPYLSHYKTIERHIDTLFSHYRSKSFLLQ